MRVPRDLLDLYANTEIKSDTVDSIVRCIRADFLLSNPHLRVTSIGLSLLSPVTAEIGFIDKNADRDQHARDQLKRLCHLLFPSGKSIHEVFFVQEFRRGLTEGRLSELPDLNRVFTSADGKYVIKSLLMRYNIPLVDFLHTLAVLVKQRMKMARLLEASDERRHLKRVA